MNGRVGSGLGTRFDLFVSDVIGNRRIILVGLIRPQAVYDRLEARPTMRILHLSTRLILGGSQENTVLSCEGQVERGHEVHLGFGPIYGPEGSLLERVEEFGRITTHLVPDLVRELSPLRDWRAYRQCRRLIRETRPDVVHTHSSKAGIVGRAAAWAEGGRAGTVRVVHTIHGLPFHPYEKKWRNAVYILSERWAAKRCHRIVTVCEAMARQSLAEKIGRPGQYVTVYSGMEVDQFLDSGVGRDEVRSELGFEEDDFIVGTVARLAELKGHDDLLEALVEPMREDSRWKLLWVGDGWWRDRLLGRARELGIEDRIINTGLIPPDEVPRFLRAMDVLVHPSYREGLPRTVPQALLSTVPVVVYDVDGGPEICVDGETGRLVPVGDLDRLREVVEWMAEHPVERAAMAERGREMCRERFRVGAMVDGLEGVYWGE